MFNYYSNVVRVAFSYFFQQFYKPSNEVVSEKGHKKLLRKNLSVVSLHVKKRLAVSYSTPHDKNIYYFLTSGKQNNTALSWLLLCRLLLPHNKKTSLISSRVSRCLLYSRYNKTVSALSLRLVN